MVVRGLLQKHFSKTFVKISAVTQKQEAQRATIAHLSPMCQGQISFQKHINGPWKPEARNQTHPSFMPVLVTSNFDDDLIKNE